MTPEQRKAISERHRPEDLPEGRDDHYCVECGYPWPCDTEQMRAALAEAEQREAALVEALERWLAWYDAGMAPVQSFDGHDGETATKSRAALAASRAALGPRP